MVTIPVKCPKCKGTKISKNGTGARGKQRYLCNNQSCPMKSFLIEYTNIGWELGIDEKIIEMTANSSGIRDISRVLRVSTHKVLDTLKKRKMPSAKSIPTT
jgi:transposase-like protein